MEGRRQAPSQLLDVWLGGGEVSSAGSRQVAM
jgi:hypothetical protein